MHAANTFNLNCIRSCYLSHRCYSLAVALHVHSHGLAEVRSCYLSYQCYSLAVALHARSHDLAEVHISVDIQSS